MFKPDESALPRRSWAIDLAPLKENPAYARLWIGGAVILLAAAGTTRWAQGLREYVPVEVGQ